ncbi:MAG: GntR family transcriptional regulator [Firmicutes bacterium]|nr:GntR family transcriptional regulator [Bacillota bacterium]
MDWKFSSDRAIYSQIVEQIKLFIVSGYFAKGDKIASVRELAADAGVNPNTMQKALTELERDGLLYSSRTSGRFITDDSELIASTKKEFADEKIADFLLSMKKLGYTRQESIQLIENYDIGGKDDE